MNVQPNYPPCFVSRQPQKAVSENNPFLNESIEQCVADIPSGQFTLPGINYAMNFHKDQGNTNCNKTVPTEP